MNAKPSECLQCVNSGPKYDMGVISFNAKGTGLNQ